MASRSKIQVPDPPSGPAEAPEGRALFSNESSQDSVSLGGTDLPRRLARLMRERGIVPEDITRESHVPVGTIMSILRGNKPTTRVKTIRRLANHFDMTPEEFLGRKPRRARLRVGSGSPWFALGGIAAIAAAVALWPRLVPGTPSVRVDGQRVVVEQPGRPAPVWSREFEERVSCAERIPWDRDQVLVGIDGGVDASGAIALYDFRTGDCLWTRPIESDSPTEEHVGPHEFAFADIEGDGVREILALFPTTGGRPVTIRILSASGELRGAYGAREP
jgi:hypothetical protein